MPKSYFYRLKTNLIWMWMWNVNCVHLSIFVRIWIWHHLSHWHDTNLSKAFKMVSLKILKIVFFKQGLFILSPINAEYWLLKGNLSQHMTLPLIIPFSAFFSAPWPLPNAWTSAFPASLSNIWDYCQKLVAHLYFNEVILFCSHLRGLFWPFLPSSLLFKKKE